MKKLILICWIACAFNALAVDVRDVGQIEQSVDIETPNFMVGHENPFYGLAFIYNNVQPIYLVDGDVVFVDPEGETVVPDQASHVGWKSRYRLALVDLDEGLNASFNNNQLTLQLPQAQTINTTVGNTENYPQFSQVRYAHLWGWLRAIALGIEWLLQTIFSVVGHWGWSVVLLSVVMKLLLMPVSLMTLKFQRQVSQYQTQLAPKLDQIKGTLKGEAAHNAMMAAHKELGISPFYALKPLFSNFIQIPILVAIFNVLGEMQGLQGQPFLWVADLSLPDAVLDFGFAVPLLGSSLNLLPIVMTVVTLLSTVFYKNDLAPDAENKKQKINLYLMAAAFFVLFYPFPAAMVLYWAMANVLQFAQQKALGN